MDKKKVIDTFCSLATLVMEKKFNFQASADCFCGLNQSTGFSFDPRVLAFIKLAVDEKLAKE